MTPHAVNTALRCGLCGLDGGPPTVEQVLIDGVAVLRCVVCWRWAVPSAEPGGVTGGLALAKADP